MVIVEPTQGSSLEPMPHELGSTQLIVYADRLGGTVRELERVLEEELEGVFDGVHLLPFYTPYDGVDAGFDPQDHMSVDPRLGDWDDIAALARNFDLTADVIVNHMSANSRQFADVKAHGDRSVWAPMFLRFEDVFPHGASESDLASIYRPRPGLPFTSMRLGDRQRLVWTTFTQEQIDLNVAQPETRAYLSEVVDCLTHAGVRLVRLDAVGYVGKQAGTTCFMTPAARDFIAQISDVAHRGGAQVLLEVHGHYSEQVSMAADVDWVYDFALPPLVLYALHAADLGPLREWLRVRPANCVSVLDTHDGIGIVDVGAGVPGPGLLTDAQIDWLVEAIHEASGGTSREATGSAASNLDLYQVNCTFFDALGGDDRAMALARLIQLFLPGVAQVYYVGLFAGSNDMALLAASGQGRDVNRHHFALAEVHDALSRPVVDLQLQALRLRRTHPAFGGRFSWEMAGSKGRLACCTDDVAVELTFDVSSATFEVREFRSGGSRILLDDSLGRS